jgi:hypothetical protein
MERRPLHWTSLPLAAMPGVRNVEGISPSPARMKVFEMLVPQSMWHVGIGFQPVLQFQKICA